ncbi:chloramphenicol acetyltransferase [Sinanaerobacter sp. ZZT-01]|uniref:chloramphenicol acetyltransferase n=1 Tax=Sinanaerobacter sp. ZZT-01 TaxID=3111540 RepID=UPI002D76AEB0|nr:chloramphenicol acetyltransferase [Sinanaerobacter sp. ZZT-01]WRR92265.1 chloramphenicol acetyltransferase [Sinanaerobacter sp. ZZT-01]
MNQAEFHLIDMEKYERREHFDYYMKMVRTNYNLTADLDLTAFYKRIKSKKIQFYPAFIYAIIMGINQNKEFRMQVDAEGRLGYWNFLHPSYTIFHEDDHTFSDIWSEFHPDFLTFYKNATEDMKTYRGVKGVKTKPDKPQNFCPISGVPWLHFTNYSCDTFTEPHMYFPVISFGKYIEKQEKVEIPLSIFVNHAVADGYHSCKLFNDIQNIVEKAEEWI